MSKDTHVVGVDPGIVHTGVVSVRFVPRAREIIVHDNAVLGLSPDTVADVIADTVFDGLKPYVFIEGYRPRSHLTHDKDMVTGVKDIRVATGGKVLDNTGIKTVVKPEVLKLLGIWNFSTTTHHQDLRSAARILVLGMMKDPELNELLADVVRDHLNNNTWKVRA